jgi:hypothetical protein
MACAWQNASRTMFFGYADSSDIPDGIFLEQLRNFERSSPRANMSILKQNIISAPDWRGRVVSLVLLNSGHYAIARHGQILPDLMWEIGDRGADRSVRAFLSMTEKPHAPRLASAFFSSYCN